MILALETATNICSVALENQAGDVFEKRTDARNAHSEQLFLFIRGILDEHEASFGDVSAVLVSEGPGSYTGLRIAASGTKGLLFGSDTPLYSVPTLASFGCAALEQKPAATTIHAIIDARRVHVYHQKFNVSGNLLEATTEVDTIPIDSFESMVRPGDIIIGTGIERLEEKLVRKVHCLNEEFISARSLIQLFHRQEADKFIKKISPARFDPQYYTSNQVQNS